MKINLKKNTDYVDSQITISRVIEFDSRIIWFCNRMEAGGCFLCKRHIDYKYTNSHYEISDDFPSKWYVVKKP